LSAPTNNQIYRLPANQFSPSAGTTLPNNPKKNNGFSILTNAKTGKIRLDKKSLEQRSSFFGTRVQGKIRKLLDWTRKAW